MIYSPQKLVNKDQRVMKCAARLVYKVPRPEHVISLLVELHWFLIKRRTEYKMITCTAPPYLSDLPEQYTTSRILRSSAYVSYSKQTGGKERKRRKRGEKERERKKKKKIKDSATFLFIGSSFWNSLSLIVRHDQTLSSYQS